MNSSSTSSVSTLYKLDIFVEYATGVQPSVRPLVYNPYIFTEIQELGSDNDQLQQTVHQKVQQIQQNVKNQKIWQIQQNIRNYRLKCLEYSSMKASLSTSLCLLWIRQEFLSI